MLFFFFSSRRRHTTSKRDWSSDVCSSDLGYQRAEVLKQLEDRRHDSEAYVMPQREEADIVISFIPPPEYATAQDNTRLNVRITLRHPIPLPDLKEALAASLRLERGSEGTDVLEIDGRISDAATQAIEDRMWEHMATARHLRSDRVGVFQDGAVQRRSNPLAVTQLVLTYYLVKASALALKLEGLRQESEPTSGAATGIR